MPTYTLPKTYDFSTTEQRIYDWWEKSGAFKPSNDPLQPGFDPTKKPFVIAIPPPNVTGELHLGHAMFVSMEDLMIRYHRMKGIPTLWILAVITRYCNTITGRKSPVKRRNQRDDIAEKNLSAARGNGKKNTGDHHPTNSPPGRIL